MKKTKIEIPIFATYLLIYKTDKWNVINETYNTDIDNGTYAVTFPYTDENHFVQYVAAFKEKPTNAIIAHECVHLVNLLFKTVGAKLDVDNDEVQAYLTEWFFEQIESFFDYNETQFFTPKEYKEAVESIIADHNEPQRANKTTITLRSDKKSWPLGLFQNTMGIRNGAKRPNLVAIDCYEVADSVKLCKIIKYLQRIRSQMQ